MIHLILLAFGVCCALLCHWILNNTYEGCKRTWSKGKLEYKAEGGEKVKMPRYFYFCLWLFCTLLAPLAWLALMFVLFMVREDSDMEFIYTNKFLEWLKQEV